MTARLSAQTIEVTSTGVGIGTASPSVSLHVRKDQNARTAAYVENRDTSSGIDVYSAYCLFNGNSSVTGMFLAGVNHTGYELVTANRLSLYTNNAAGMAFSVDAAGPIAMATSGNERLRIDSSGNVGIGTSTPAYLLTVNGAVRASQFIGDVNTYSDFVFKPGYKLESLDEVEVAIKRDGHLPGIPDEAEVKLHGVDLAVQQARLLQKVEELTLYIIELERKNAELRVEVNQIKGSLR